MPNAPKRLLLPMVGGLAIVALACYLYANRTAKAQQPKDSTAVTETPDTHDNTDHAGRIPIPSDAEIAKLPSDGGPNYNRLIFEKSPYLLQHAGNPVDWYPWGQEAFDKAKRENKPILLSVGYSTCHWCHVMEHESFEVDDVGELLNRHFVAIKVDREERPDVDRVYMSYTQASTGSGGWPMNVWLTPDLKPFFAGTYFPPEDKWGRPGFKTILNRLAQAWDEKADDIRKSGDEAIAHLKRMDESKEDPDLKLQQAILDRGYEQIISAFDPRYGGFGNAPKFPRPVTPAFLLRYDHRNGATKGRDAVLHTLRKMADGGIHDHVGKGFSRYAVDERWHVPHFEKMLYDQGQLVPLYVDAFRITKDPYYADIARDILTYVQRDMTGEFGQFYSAEDADSPLPENPKEQAEGAFYVWEQSEINAALPEADAKLFSHYFGVKANGNVDNDPHNEFANKNVLIIEHNIEDTAKHFKRTPDDVRAVIATSLNTLFPLRERRPRPHLDDKTITAWNGLMISAFAQAYVALGDPAHLDAARNAAAFIRTKLYDDEAHTLQRRYRAGETAIDGYVDDYAYLIQALLDLYDATFDTSYIRWARDLQATQDKLFWDHDEGGYFSTSGEDASILVRMKEMYDGAEPSPNSIAALNLQRLTSFSDTASYAEKPRLIFLQLGRQLTSSPSATPQMLIAIDAHLYKAKQIVIAGDPGKKDTQALLKAIREAYLPHKVVLLADGAEHQDYLAQELAFLKDVRPMDGKATAYVCENFVCQLPTTDVAVMMKQLGISTSTP
jgi:uncharacterized protein